MDTVIKLPVEGLQGLHHSLHKLKAAQAHAGGPEKYWMLVAQDYPEWSTCSGSDPSGQCQSCAACDAGELRARQAPTSAEHEELNQ